MGGRMPLFHKRPPGARIACRGAVAACLLAFGCASGPPSGDVLFGGRAAPQPVAASGPLDGLYAGTANVLVNGDLTCPLQLSISNFRVQDNVVSLGGFRAPIAPDGTITNVPFEGMFLTGRFVGPHFTGAVDAQSNLQNIRPLKTCIYALDVRRVAG